MDELNKLNEAFEKLKALQDDMHPGLYTWNLAMRDALVDIHSEAAKLIGK